MNKKKVCTWVCPKCGMNETAPASGYRLCRECASKMKVITKENKVLERLED